jgi:hypothetical membrane protein
VGPTLFVAAFLIEGATRPGYSAWHTLVSQLSLGDQGWMQIANFIASGVLIVAFAIGLRRVLRTGTGARAGPILLGAVGVGLIIAGFFATDPGLGYPPGTADGFSASLSTGGSVHVFGALLFVVALALACFVLARRFATDERAPSWARYSVASGVLVVALFIAANVAVSDGQSLVAFAGLLQRASIVAGFGWIVLVATRSLREVP